ncbi:MAG: hypothetical protein LBU95_02230, partial [Rikenellaceae bacterium]|nr:hypothetical protein [Rikenellaceae bacterium]
MQYYASDDKNKKGKVWAAAMTLLAYLVCLVLMLFIRFGLPAQPAEGEGIMINFGDVAEAGGEHDTAMTDDQAAVPSQPQAQPTEPVRTADPRALFPGRTAGSTSTSEGTSTGAGNQ